MDLSPNEIAEIHKEVEATARALHTAHLTRGEGSLEQFMSFFDEDVFAIGTGEEEALQRLEEHGKTDVVLVLSDINMPGMTGLELLQRIKSDPPPVPVCMMTAYDNEEYRGKAADLECDGYVSKPIDFAALKEEIASFRST